MPLGTMPVNSVFTSALVAVMLTACSDQPTAVRLRSPTANEVLASVNPELGSRLGPDGRFALATIGGADEITAERAKELAEVWAKRFAPLAMTWLQKTRGAPISFKTLKPCGRVFYARSAFSPLSAVIPAANRRMWGAWWLVTLCSGNEAQVSLGVSAQATEVKIEQGRLVFPFASGNELFPMGIPVGQPGEYPLSPEAAVERVASIHGRLISRMPELIMPPHTNGFPQAARWQVHLESMATVRVGFHEILAGDIYVGRDGSGPASSVSEFVPSSEQPNEISFFFAPEPNIGESGRDYEQRLGLTLSRAVATRKSGLPVNFETARAGGVN